MVKDAIQSAGEKKLYEQLLQHLKDHNYTGDSRAELEFKALELHASGSLMMNFGWITCSSIRSTALKSLIPPDWFW